MKERKKEKKKEKERRERERENVRERDRRVRMCTGAHGIPVLIHTRNAAIVEWNDVLRVGATTRVRDINSSVATRTCNTKVEASRNLETLAS